MSFGKNWVKDKFLLKVSKSSNVDNYLLGFLDAFLLDFYKVLPFLDDF